MLIYLEFLLPNFAPHHNRGISFKVMKMMTTIMFIRMIIFHLACFYSNFSKQWNFSEFIISKYSSIVALSNQIYIQFNFSHVPVPVLVFRDFCLFVFSEDFAAGCFCARRQSISHCCIQGESKYNPNLNPLS